MVQHSEIAEADRHPPKTHNHDSSYYTKTLEDTWRNGVSQTEMGYLNGINSSIQTQLNGKAATVHTHTESQITDLDHNAQEIKGKTITPTWTTDYILVYNGTQWVMELKGTGGGASSLNDLSDVTITTSASGDTLINDGVDFKNTNIDARIKATKLDDFATPNDNIDLNASTGQHGLLPKLAGGTVDFLRADGTWATPPGAAGGETNTASNQGVGGVGVYYQKSGVDIQFKNINAGSNQISIVDDTTNHEIDIDVVEANIKLDNLGAPEDNIDLNANASVHGLLPKLGGGTVNFLRADGSWAEPPGASGGEANTASNVGTAGVGVFKQKTGADLEFKKINAGSSNITISTANDEVDVDVGSNVFLADGTVVMTAAIAMGTNKITGLGDPTLAQDAATKAWVDAHNWATTDITSGTLAVSRGGTGQSTAQAAIDALSLVAGATNEYVLTKDTDTGSATWKAATGGSGETNTASNTGTVGTGVFKQKTGADLELYKLYSANNRLTIGLNGTDRMDFTINESNINAGQVDGKDASDLVLRDGTNSLTGNWNPDGNGTRKFGDATHKLAEIWAVDGIFGDLVFEERTCYICGKTFIDDDILSLIVIKTAKNGTHVVPVHISCIGGAN